MKAMRCLSPLQVLVIALSLVGQSDRFAPQSLIQRLRRGSEECFDNIFLKKLGDSVAKPTNANAREHVSYSDGVELDYVKPPQGNDPVMPKVIAPFKKPIMDQWVHAELILPQGELFRKAKVILRTKDGNGDVAGLCDPNPFLNTFIMLSFLMVKSKSIRLM